MGGGGGVVRGYAPTNFGTNPRLFSLTLTGSRAALADGAEGGENRRSAEANGWYEAEAKGAGEARLANPNQSYAIKPSDSLGIGEGGIRTLDTGIHPYDGLANRWFQPLTHLSRRSTRRRSRLRTKRRGTGRGKGYLTRRGASNARCPCLFTHARPLMRCGRADLLAHPIQRDALRLQHFGHAARLVAEQGD